MPRLGKLPQLNRKALLVALSWAGSLVLGGWMAVGLQHKRSELSLGLDVAVQDSTRYAAIIKTNERLQARRDTIAQKLEIIQDIDANRYMWAHILDEVSRTLPDYTWLTNLTFLHQDTTAGATPLFRLEGKTGSTLALTQFMQDLEASPFVRNVRLVTTEGTTEQGRFVHGFTLEANYEVPPADAIQTVPLFTRGEE